MFATILHILLLGLLFVAMAFGALLTLAGTYAATIHKGRTRAALTLNATCWAGAVAGVTIFILAASLLIPQVMA